MKNEDSVIKLSIIIPYYNQKENIRKLIKVLDKQMTKEVEVIIVNDGTDDYFEDIEYPKNKFIVFNLEENSGGASIPRNKGLDIAEGKYIAFIDSDDMISEDYISTILHKTLKEWDYCYISWKGKSNTIIIENEPPKWNCCVWNCIYKRDLIGNERFNPELKMAEDYDFNNRVRKGKRANITKMIYYYNEETPNSLTKQGELYNSKYKGDDNNAL